MLDTKKILSLVGILAVVVIVLAGYLTWSRQTFLKNEFERVSKYNANLHDSMRTYTDENGHLHAKIETLVTSRDAYASSHKDIDSLAKVLDVKLRNINSVLRLQTQTVGNINSKVKSGTQLVPYKLPGDTTTRYDTVRFSDVRFKDNWMTFDGRLKGDSFNAKYSVRDSFTFVTYTKSSGFLGLGKKRTYVDVTGANPNTRYSNMSSVELTKIRPKRWSIGPYVGYGTMGGKFGPAAGVSLQRSIIRF